MTLQLGGGCHGCSSTTDCRTAHSFPTGADSVSLPRKCRLCPAVIHRARDSAGTTASGRDRSKIGGAATARLDFILNVTPSNPSISINITLETLKNPSERSYLFCCIRKSTTVESARRQCAIRSQVHGSRQKRVSCYIYSILRPLEL